MYYISSFYPFLQRDAVGVVSRYFYARDTHPRLYRGQGNHSRRTWPPSFFSTCKHMVAYNTIISYIRTVGDVADFFFVGFSTR